MLIATSVLDDVGFTLYVIALNNGRAGFKYVKISIYVYYINDLLLKLIYQFKLWLLRES